MRYRICFCIYNVNCYSYKYVYYFLKKINNNNIVLNIIKRKGKNIKCYGEKKQQMFFFWHKLNKIFVNAYIIQNFQGIRIICNIILIQIEKKKKFK